MATRTNLWTVKEQKRFVARRDLNDATIHGRYWVSGRGWFASLDPLQTFMVATLWPSMFRRDEVSQQKCLEEGPDGSHVYLCAMPGTIEKLEFRSPEWRSARQQITRLQGFFRSCTEYAKLMGEIYEPGKYKAHELPAWDGTEPWSVHLAPLTDRQLALGAFWRTVAGELPSDLPIPRGMVRDRRRAAPDFVAVADWVLNKELHYYAEPSLSVADVYVWEWPGMIPERTIVPLAVPVGEEIWMKFKALS